MRLKDLYKMISQNQACILPEPSIQSNDGIPMFQIFTEDFRERKHYDNFRFNFILRDTKKNTCQLMGDIIKPQILKLQNRNQNFQQSESIFQLKSKLQELKKQKKEEEFQKLREEMKIIELNKTQIQRKKSVINERGQSPSNTTRFNNSSLQLQIIPQNLLMPQNPALIRQRTIIKKSNAAILDHDEQSFQDSPSSASKLSRNSGDKRKSEYIPRQSTYPQIHYDTQTLLKATIFQDNEQQNNNDPTTTDQDNKLEVKEKWVASKLKLEKKIAAYNAKHKKVKQIINLIKDRPNPEPNYRFEQIKNKYELRTLKNMNQLSSKGNLERSKDNINQRKLVEKKKSSIDLLEEELNSVVFFQSKDRPSIKRLTKM